MFSNNRTLGWMAAALVFVIYSGAVQAEPNGKNWPQFRGTDSSGIADGFATPTKWRIGGKKTARNIAWKTPIEGLGHSSPIIWGDRLFVTSAISGQKDASLKVGLYGDIQPVQDDSVHQWKVYCLDKPSGKVLWEKTICEGVPKIKRHTKATHANSTAATDGKYLVVLLGSEGLHCFDMDGKLLWKKDFGVLDSGYYVVPAAQWEFGSSPIIHDGNVIIQCDVQKDSFLAAFDAKDGKELWRTPRDDVPTWSTPNIHVGGKKPQLVVNGYKHAGGYDPQTGKELWRMKGGGDIPVPTPVFSDGLAFIAHAHGMAAPMYAVRMDQAEGDISLNGEATSNGAIAWCDPWCGSYMQTPLVYGNYLYAARDNGVLTCYEAKTGKQVYRERLGSGETGFTASPVAADGKIYYTSEDGDIYVIKAGPIFKQLAKNRMNEVCMATPAISEGTVYFRTQGHVVAVRDLKKPETKDADAKPHKNANTDSPKKPSKTAD